MTIKISPIAYKKPIRAKEDNEEYAIDVEIVWNEEFSELMDFGIIEMLDRESKKKPPVLIPNISFNGEKNLDGQLSITIKKSTPKIIATLKQIADSYTMVELQELIA